jgi:hypothetical protein
MSVGAFITALRKAGVPAEQILDAVEVMEQERLAKGRARTAKCRNAKRDGDVTHVTNVTRVTPEPHSTESRVTHVGDNSKTLETSGKEGRKKERARAARIPPDFQPSIDDALAEGLSRPIAEREARKFVDHFLGAPGERGLKQNWPATWRNWCRRIGDGPYHQSQGPPTNGTHPRKLSTAEQAIHELNKYRDTPEPPLRSEADFGSGATIETRDFRRVS